MNTIYLCTNLLNRRKYTFLLFTDFLFCIFFGGLQCVGHGYSFACVANFEFLRDVWIRTQRAAVASRRATNLATYLPLFTDLIFLPAIYFVWYWNLRFARPWRQNAKLQLISYIWRQLSEFDSRHLSKILFKKRATEAKEWQTLTSPPKK